MHRLRRLFGRLPGRGEKRVRHGRRQPEAVYKPFAQAAPNKVVIDKKGASPCKFRCPAHMDAHGYIALAGQGRWEEALDVVPG
jgi:NADPH-dependent glutamate synthase beta subunit-like oxidoreductase